MAQRWVERRGTKRTGFRYVGPDGRPVRDRRTLDRIKALVIPPAWRDVHIAMSSRAAIQAWGFDARGRRQYRYHERAVEVRELRKYHRVRQLARDLPRIRRRLDADWKGRELTRAKVCAGVVRLISEGFFRVGNERATRENRTFGITTLLKTHVAVADGCIRFSYRGKGGVTQRNVVVDRELAGFVAALAKLPGRRLFRYRNEQGEWQELDARDVNEYLHDLVSVPYTAKDFRTWGGTLRLAIVLAELGPATSEREGKRNVALAMRLVASELGNTPTICRKSYVHPQVIARYLDEGETIAGDLVASSQRRGRYAHAPEERALIRFLDRHFPDRRQAPRTGKTADARRGPRSPRSEARAA